LTHSSFISIPAINGLGAACCIALVGCETDKPTSSGTVAEITSLAQLVAKRLYDSGNGAINV
jgi:hypothetical protein